MAIGGKKKKVIMSSEELSSFCDQIALMLSSGMTLRDGCREYYYRALDRHFPGLKEVYIRTYGNAYEIPSPHSRLLLKCYRDTCEKYGIWHGTDQIFRYLRTFEDKQQSEQISFL